MFPSKRSSVSANSFYQKKDKITRTRVNKRSRIIPSVVALLLVVGLGPCFLQGFFSLEMDREARNALHLSKVGRSNPYSISECTFCKQDHVSNESHKSTFEFCNSLDWHEPLTARTCENCSESTLEFDIARCEETISRDSQFNLIVHYVYFESDTTPEDELQNKRINLEFFLQQAVLNSAESVHFFFSIAGVLPQANDYFTSLGVPQDRFRELIVPTNLQNVHVEEIPAASSDLCIHGRWMTQRKNHIVGPSSFVLLLNEGVRGPIVQSKYYELLSKSTMLSKVGVPAWFLPYLIKFSKNDRLSVVGTMMSTEFQSHVQSYALAIRTSPAALMNDVGSLLLRSCQLTKLESIFIAEIGLSQMILAKKHALGSFYPRINNFTAWHDFCTNVDVIPSFACTVPKDQFHLWDEEAECHSRMSLGIDLLNRNRNPTSIFVTPVEDLVFVKFGGEVFRKNLLPASLREELLLWTTHVLRLPISWKALEIERIYEEEENGFKSFTSSRLAHSWMKLFLQNKHELQKTSCIRDSFKFEWAAQVLSNVSSFFEESRSQSFNKDIATEVLPYLETWKNNKTSRSWGLPSPFLSLVDTCPLFQQNDYEI